MKVGYVMLVVNELGVEVDIGVGLIVPWIQVAVDVMAVVVAAVPVVAVGLAVVDNWRW